MKIRHRTEIVEVIGVITRFHRNEVVAAVLDGLGTIPAVREEWMMAEMQWSREGRQTLTRGAERGSIEVESLAL